MDIALYIQRVGYGTLVDNNYYYVAGYGYITVGVPVGAPPPPEGGGGLLLLSRGFQRGLRR